MITKLLIANRGEIACRIIRTAREMGIATGAVYSDADAKALHVRTADEAVHIGPSPAAESYLVGEKIIAAAKQTGAEAIHPGYGFLSENAGFAQAVIDAGLIYIHNRMEEGNWQVQLRTTANHLENWLSSPAGLDETMVYEKVLVDGDMAQVWGPYSFHVGDTVSHCGINSMSMVKTDDGWKVGNTSFTMTSVDECGPLNSPIVIGKIKRPFE